MNIWVWIAIFIVAWLLEALASASKNKQRQQQEQQQRQRDPQGIPRSPVQPRRAPPVLTRPQPPASRLARFPPPAHPVADPALREAPPPMFEVPVVRPPRARELERTTAAEGTSAEVEVVEAAPESTEVSHRRVTEKYRGPAPGEIGGEERPRPQARFALRPRTVREAIVWMEILGPPKSERA